MERNFDNRDFEHYLKKNADQYRMYPSEKVWEEIHYSLHPRRRWTGLAISLLLITGSVVSAIMFFSPATTDKQEVASRLATDETPKNKTTPKNISNPAPTPLLTVTNTGTGFTDKLPSIVLPVNEPAAGSEPLRNEEVKIEDAAYEITNPELVLHKSSPVVKTSTENIELLKTTVNTAISPSGYLNIISAGIPEIKPTRLIALSNHSLNTKADLFNKKNPAASAEKLITHQKRNQKFSLQFYFTPGVSYRRLTENKEVILAASGPQSISTSLALKDVNTLVTHKPDLGFELGLGAKYALGKRVFLKTGLQFNVNKYDIRAFSYTGEQAVIAIEGNNQQPVTRFTYYRNSDGYRPNWLTNVYFSVSIPVGTEIKLLNKKNFDLGIGVTAQPTYMLSKNAYLISTDFKNYVEVPDLIRRWNINTGGELFVGIKSGRTRWQVGPQVRYQVLSSFKDKYPVRENLFNYGLKAAISLNSKN
jgi:hypothetical protein